MPTYNITAKKKGVNVLASTTYNDAFDFLSCVLHIGYYSPDVQSRMTQATISLNFFISIHGSDDKVCFTLVYNPSIVHSASLAPAAVSLSPDQLKEIARADNPQLHRLSLDLNKPCGVKCPRLVGNISPKHDLDSTYGALKSFADATEIHLLLDYNFIHADNRQNLTLLLNHPGRYPSPLDVNVRPPSSAFRLFEDSVSESPPDEEPPPTYTDASVKRPRPASSHSSPPPKRVFGSPQPTLDIAFSPTEKATTIPDDASPKPPPSPLSYTPTPDFQEAVTNAVEALLPALLPKYLQHVLTTPSTSPSPSQSPAPAFVPDPKSSLRKLLKERDATMVENMITRLHDRAIEHADDRCRWTCDEFQETIDDHKRGFAHETEESIARLGLMFDEVEDKLVRLGRMLDEELQKSASEIMEKLDDASETVCAKCAGRLDNETEMDCSQSSARLSEFGRLRRPPTNARVHTRLRRASSLP